jgi:hypothetical protein
MRRATFHWRRVCREVAKNVGDSNFYGNFKPGIAAAWRQRNCICQPNSTAKRKICSRQRTLTMGDLMKLDGAEAVNRNPGKGVFSQPTSLSPRMANSA